MPIIVPPDALPHAGAPPTRELPARSRVPFALATTFSATECRSY